MESARTPEQRRESIAKGIATRRRNIELRKIEQQRKRDEADRLLQLITERKQVLDEIERGITCTKIAGKLSNNTLLREEDIIAQAQPWENCSGIYFLISDGKVVYVGQSVNVFSRIQQHVGNTNRKFDSFAYVPCAKKQLDMLESLYIHYLRPQANAVVQGRVIAPLTLDQIFEGIMGGISS